MAWILFLARRTSGMALLGWCELTTWKEATLAWLLVHLWGKARRSAAVWGPPGGGASRAPFERETRSAGGSTARRHVTLEPTTLPE